MRAIRVFCGITIVFLIGAFSLFVYEEILKKRAEALIRTTYDLSNWTETPPTLADLESKFHGGLKPMEGCTPSECGYEASVSNRVISALRLAPRTALIAEYSVRDGTVETSMLDYTTTVQSDRTIVVHSQMDFNKGVLFALHPWEDSSPLDSNGLVTVCSGNSQAERQSALALNVSCMTKVRGCPTIAELLPTIWERGQSGTIKSRLQNHEGFIDAPDWIRR